MRLQNKNFLVFKNNEKVTAIFNGLNSLGISFTFITKLVWRVWWKILSQIH